MAVLGRADGVMPFIVPAPLPAIVPVAAQREIHEGKQQFRQFTSSPCIIPQTGEFDRFSIPSKAL
jgi:hypothetical protein